MNFNYGRDFRALFASRAFIKANDLEALLDHKLFSLIFGVSSRITGTLMNPLELLRLCALDTVTESEMTHQKVSGLFYVHEQLLTLTLFPYYILVYTDR